MVTKTGNQPNIPPAYKDLFIDGIRHPYLYLWDAWSYCDKDTLHLYCLAISRKLSTGKDLTPSYRNEYPFHIRHFSSTDDGVTWKDEGAFLSPRQDLGKFDSRTIWSGSIDLLKDGRKLVAYTGLDEVDPEHNFLQHIGLAISTDGYSVDKLLEEPISSPRRDWRIIKDKGYYLDLPENLGSNLGEEGGPILAWRDPFVFQDKNDKIYLFWAAKVAPLHNAMAWAELEENGESFKIKTLHNPITLPNGKEFTQLELPKIVYDSNHKLYYLLVSTCNRIYEGQPDAEVDKCVRVYRSEDLQGPWISIGDKILGKENLFGLTVLKTDFQNNRLLCIAPYTDAADNDLSLTFSKRFYIYLDNLRVEF